MDTDDQNSGGAELAELEQAFQAEAAGIAPAQVSPAPEIIPTSSTKQSFLLTVQHLKETDAELAKKIETLKAQAKTELENLRNLKNSIAKKIGDIKELEETRHKIKQEIEKIESLSSEVDSLTNEAKNELGQA